MPDHTPPEDTHAVVLTRAAARRARAQLGRRRAQAVDAARSAFGTSSSARLGRGAQHEDEAAGQDTDSRRSRRSGSATAGPARVLTREQRLRRTLLVAGVLVLGGGAATMALESDDSAPPAAGTASSSSAQPTSRTTPAAHTSSPVPAPTVVPRGDGRFTVVPVPSQPVAATGRTYRYTLETEGGLKVDMAEMARIVGPTLVDRRGWQHHDGVRFVNVSPAQAKAGAAVDLRLTLASPATVDKLCAPLQTRGNVSCFNNGRVVINEKRWLLGAPAYAGDLAGYRTYLINHETGHGIGHGHVSCPAKGKRAPVMLQQTLGLQGCTKWPYPSGA